MLSVRTLVNSRLIAKLKEDAGASYPTLNVTGTRNGSPRTFPTLNVDSLGEVSTGDDLEHIKQNAIISTIELKTYAIGKSGRIVAARQIMDKAGDVMLSMGYSLIYGPEDISSGDIGIMVARFRRTVGTGDIEHM